MLAWVKTIGLGSPVVPEVKYSPQVSSAVIFTFGGFGDASRITSSKSSMPSGTFAPAKM